jgi:hypothetical protein
VQDLPHALPTSTSLLQVFIFYISAQKQFTEDLHRFVEHDQGML